MPPVPRNIAVEPAIRRRPRTEVAQHSKRTDGPGKLATVSIVIPTFNRAAPAVAAVTAALAQSHPRTVVIVIDDGSTDGTRKAMSRFFDKDRLVYVRLARNMGAAAARNVGILMSATDAVTFHDSDDIPHREKVLRQARLLGDPLDTVQPIRKWTRKNRVGAVLTHHELLLADGFRVAIRRALPLTEDFGPDLQQVSGVPGDWTHVNAGLFHRGVFERLGGFSDGIDGARAFCNRLIRAGEELRVIPEILLTKIESPETLTKPAVPGHVDAGHAQAAQRRTGQPERVPIDLPDLEIAEIVNPGRCGVSRALSTPATRGRLMTALSRGAVRVA